MKKNGIKINSNEVRSFQIITCPICGFTFRLFEKRTRKKKRNCPICGAWIFGLDFNKFKFMDRNIYFHKVR